MIAHCLTGDKKTWLLILAKPLLCRLLVNHSLSVYPLVSMGSRKDRIQMKPQPLAGRLEQADLSVAFQPKLFHDEMRQNPKTHFSPRQQSHLQAPERCSGLAPHTPSCCFRWQQKLPSSQEAGAAESTLKE